MSSVSIPVAEAKLPSNLHSVYGALKRKTNYIARWLIENGGVGKIAAQPPGERVCNVDELRSFANNVVDRNVAVPNHVLEALAFVVKARSEISRWYRAFVQEGNRKQRKSNKTHAHFTDCLRQIHDIFLKHRSTSTTQPGGQQDESHLLTPPAAQSTGSFHVLLGLTDHDLATLPPDTISANQGEEFTPKPGPGESEEMPYVVQDDGMVDKVKFVLAILRSKTYWIEVAGGSMSFLLATYLTTFHVVLAKEEFAQTLEQHQISSNEELIKNYQLIQDPSALVKANAVFGTGVGFQTPPKALRLAQGCSPYGMEQLSDLEKLGITYDKDVSHMVELMDISRGMMNAASEGSGQLGIKSMRRWLKDNYNAKEALTSTPKDPYVEAASCTTDNELVLHLEILWGISTSLTEALRKLRKALVLGGEEATIAFISQMYNSVKQANLQHDGKHPQNVALEESLLRTSQREMDEFNPYLDHPWISGVNILNMCCDVFDSGCITVVIGHFLTIVLHSYNAARRRGLVQDIIILERLCNELEMAIFREQRPSRKFSSCFYRLVGGQIEIKHNPESMSSFMRDWAARTGRPQAATLRNSRTYDLKLPVKGMLERPASDDISFAHACWRSVKQGPIPEDTWSQIEKKLGDRKPKRSKQKDSTSVRMSKLRKAIEPEFVGDFPVAGINFYALYSACERFLTMVGKRYLTAKELHSNVTFRQAGWSLLLQFLCAADDLTPEMTLVFRQLLLEPILDEFKDKGPEDFLWPMFAAAKMGEAKAQEEHDLANLHI